MRKQKAKLAGGIFTGTAFIIVLIVVINCMVKIPAGDEGVIYSMNGGVKDNTLTPGYHITKPAEHVKCFTTSNEQLLAI